MTLFDRLFKTMINPWVVFAYLTGVGLSILFLDKPLAIFFHQLPITPYKWILQGITYFGTASAYFISLSGLFVVTRYLYRNKKWTEYFRFLLLSLTVSTLVCLVLKVTLGRARPELFFDKGLYGFYGFQKSSLFWSFPSGHTSTIMSLVFAICVLFPRAFYWTIFFGLTVVASRVMLTQHFLADVMMGSYLALLEVGVLAYFFKRMLAYKDVSIA